MLASLVLSLLMQPGTAWRCSNDASCQLNGQCQRGACICDPQWRGTNCSALNTGRSWKSYTGSQPNTRTWGESALQHDDGLYHGYFAEMLNHCMLDTWKLNSATVHAVSTSPFGPFTFQDMVQQPWSHNPLVARDPATGDWLVAHIGCGTPRGPMQNCSGDAGHLHPGPVAVELRDLPPCVCPGPEGQKGEACQTLQVLRGASPEGPWEDAQVAWPLQEPGAWPGAYSNPSLLFVGNRTFLGFSGNLAPPDNHGPTGHPGLLVSENGWRGPYTYVQADGNKFLTSRGYAEDIDLFQDRRGYFHMLMHGFYDQFPGAHGWSADGLHWEFSETAAYTHDVVWGDTGEHATLSKRERPQVLTVDGVPAVLYNGARDQQTHLHTYNMATEILGTESKSVLA